jgi:hypothetical protein
MMMNSSFARQSISRSLRLLSAAAAALLMFSTAASQRAEALSPINPGPSANKTNADGLTIEVRGGHGGGGGGGGGGGRGYGGGVRGGSFSAGPAISRGGVGHFAGGRGFGHGFRHRHGFFVGGVYYDDYPDDYDYPYYDYPPVTAVPGCRIVPTIDGPRRVCHYRAARHHRHYRRHDHRRHHRA